MISSASLKHPKMQDKIMSALIEANENAVIRKGHGKAYIENSKGNNIMRLDVFKAGVVDHLPNGGVIVYGESSRQITGIVEKSIGDKLSSFL